MVANDLSHNLGSTGIFFLFNELQYFFTLRIIASGEWSTL
jgi:hypothetical protein